MDQRPGELNTGAAAHEAIRTAFGCDGGLAVVIGACARPAGLAAGAVLWPLADRDETTLLVEGRAREVAYGRDGAMLLIDSFEPGDMFGAVVGPADGATMVEGVTAGQGACFSEAALLRLMDSYVAVALGINRQLARRLLAMRRRMVETTLLSATGRVAAELLRRAAAAPDRTIRPMPVISELAVVVQATRETVSRTVSQLERRGVIRRVDGGLEITAPHRLEELAY